MEMRVKIPSFSFIAVLHLQKRAQIMIIQLNEL